MKRVASDKEVDAEAIKQAKPLLTKLQVMEAVEKLAQMVDDDWHNSWESGSMLIFSKILQPLAEHHELILAQDRSVEDDAATCLFIAEMIRRVKAVPMRTMREQFSEACVDGAGKWTMNEMNEKVWRTLLERLGDKPEMLDQCFCNSVDAGIFTGKETDFKSSGVQERISKGGWKLCDSEIPKIREIPVIDRRFNGDRDRRTRTPECIRCGCMKCNCSPCEECDGGTLPDGSFCEPCCEICDRCGGPVGGCAGYCGREDGY